MFTFSKDTSGNSNNTSKGIPGTTPKGIPVTTPLPPVTTDNITTREDLCCSEENLLYCEEVNFNPEVITTKTEINILETVLYRSNTVEPNGFVYKNNWLDEAVLSYSKKTGNLFGSFHVQGREYEIEKCAIGHVLKERKKEAVMEHDEEGPGPQIPEVPEHPALVWAGMHDQNTIATFTIKFYYNEEFAQFTPDIDGWVDSTIALVNQAMINSQVPVRMKKFATEMAMIPEFRDCS